VKLKDRLDIVMIGLSITSSWGNGHATTYRALVRALADRGHRVLFLERDVPWYADNRDLPEPPYCQTALYGSVEELKDLCGGVIRAADLVIVGSFVPDGVPIAEWVLRTARGHTAFYDIDTPVTIAGLERGSATYITRELIPRFDLYLSFTGGPILARLERELGAAMARPLYCSFDAEQYHPPQPHGRGDEADRSRQWDLGYMGTYSADRQPALDELLFAPADRMGGGRFVVAGPLYPADIRWPDNVQHFQHLAPGQHREFYGAQRFTLNLTRAEMKHAGFAPSVRLFEAAACGTPIISDAWRGLDTFFTPGEEILIASSASDVVRYLSLLDESEAHRIGARARRRVIARHTADHRAAELLSYVAELRERGAFTRRREAGDRTSPRTG
jgi:spore maturation protein CgeB